MVLVVRSSGQAPKSILRSASSVALSLFYSQTPVLAPASCPGRKLQCVACRNCSGAHALRMAGDATLHASATACGRLCHIGNIKRRRRMTTGTNAFPVLRWVGLVWTVVWLPTYIRVWGLANLLHLCDIAVILGCAGLWWGSSLLISSQAVSSLAAGIFWSLDVGWRLVTGRFFVVV